MPRVSVIIPTFNLAHYLARALDSVVSQTFTDYEVIVADDGSTDDTQSLVDRYGGKVKYLYQSNRGVSAARNLALTKATGEFIAYLDADDMWYAHKLARQVSVLDAHKECEIVHSDAAFIDEHDGILFDSYLRHIGRAGAQGSCLFSLLRKNTILTPTTVIERRNCIEKVGLFDERLNRCEEYLRWLLLAIEGVVFAYIDEPLAMYRQTSGSLSRDSRAMLEDHLRTFNILLDETSLASRFGPEATDIVRHRLYAVERDLAYLDRTDGQTSLARRRLTGLIKEWPMRFELYVELLKSCVSPTLAARIRNINERRV